MWREERGEQREEKRLRGEGRERERRRRRLEVWEESEDAREG